jgi:hypothetical protein
MWRHVASPSAFLCPRSYFPGTMRNIHVKSINGKGIESLVRSLLELALLAAAFSVTLGPNACHALEWIEGQGNSILMIDGASVYRSTNAGLNWNLISTLADPAGYFTRLSDGSLVTVAVRNGTTTSLDWIRSTDDGKSWSGYHSMIAGAPRNFYYGPIVVSNGGRWMYCPAYRDGDGYLHSDLMWSDDQAKTTWNVSSPFSTPSDGNRGLSEANIAQIGPNKFVAAIRSDDGAPSAWDGFYLSHSTDGLNWTVPEPTAPGEVGRMPLFYHIDNPGNDNDYWMLSYRTYVGPQYLSYAAARFSRDGETWSDPYRFLSGVGTNGFFVESANQWYLFATAYPSGQIIRQPVNLDAIANQMLPPAPEPSGYVLLLSAWGAAGVIRRRAMARLARRLCPCRRQCL